ncbi:bifunctional [glutamate--ammonia ligase]-adenylyl-L-tyrosine phosphorylase/[glutamate--ammonia-ligase] adenylyltransferase [Pseudoxanthomonas kalamensis DSM 18571]|uniref:bifunctional [glutamate--ammonia ligase]-adenylyl-L-tyrosine phosphorylase/[glutamate--ammonia-ligase] adenylyltransferase n=1 Tax=Pseudoxanthomonas kalamensis TaxID=289483 RepID=UPI00139184E4|nr:bifunctional [glutamate--ammonia ligase]-adenylyl-L-tyrosine phosphorylase/[glutamate--ammonia-ligase] adenylyltransferase [Pseudoxanthomonas kalamensis]KAF1712015.1 bifunctional [glutamate--ammonia ligase]-adenylyl-L-tyrosine phosphorylase/[glutamate--ammonia-ligase] adenylyltransferase [Pseudoxanthomonas kalamensis DSM 18571]
MDDTLREALDRQVERGLARLRAVPALQSLIDEPSVRDTLSRLIAASDFALETLCRQPQRLPELLRDASAPLPLPDLPEGLPDEWPGLLRQHRAAESLRLIWRDVVEGADVEDILAGSSRLAEQCLQAALTALEGEFVRRHGTVRTVDGTPQRLVVFALGKLGGGELNFSSDIDLVYAYPEGGQSDGARALAAEDYFARLGQRLARLLDEPTVDGFCHRVDLRLRPFGGAGRVAMSFAGMDQYFQREGRDWERYAWMKARAVAGDIEAGEGWLEELRPFVFRRYLDFTALDGLRDMKAAIAAEVARRELAGDIKRGPGGIREIEFLAQALQLIHGGREPALRVHGLLPALAALSEARHVDARDAQALAIAYRFLRRLENRLQMMGDAQTYALPEDPLLQARIARGLGCVDWDALQAQLQAQRETVTREFDALLAPRRREAPPDALQGYWRALPKGGDPELLERAGFADPVAADAQLRDFVRSPGVRGLSDSARARLDRVLPALLAAAGTSAQADATLRRLLGLLQAILRRASYLALLDEQPSARQRLVDVYSRSALLAERLMAYPLLLDELLDTRVAGPMPGRERLREECALALQEADTESALRLLNEKRLALSFRIALAALDGRQPAADSTRQLAWLADEVVRVVLRIAGDEVVAAHGQVPGGRFAVIGYGSLGGEELGFGSDLDLVFLYDADSNAESDGPRPLDPSRWYARLAQKIVAMLGAVTSAGRLYEVDTRLRPDGSKSMLVTSLASYRDYQRERAWTWEHQALVRARGVAGNDALLQDFESIRTEVLARPREQEALRTDVIDMRRRMREALDRSDATQFDLKQGDGGLVDLEFLLQYGVLGQAHAHPVLLAPRNSVALIDAQDRAGVLETATAEALRQAHATLLAAGLACTLDRRKRIVARDDRIDAACAQVRAATRAFGLQVEPDPAGD